MGLAGAKNKRKLGEDPNNTKWLRNTGSFGQKILRAQGWQPGENLGAKDAPHAEFHTDASASHIRVVMKDDTMGLGAKRNNGDECTGLDAFQDLLGRLNGKSDEAIEGERKARSDLKLSLYVERKIGTIRFVKGGWLVGDEMKRDDDAKGGESGRTAPLPPSDNPEKSESENKQEEMKRAKKRKAEHDGDATGDADVGRESKKSKRREETDGQLDSDDRSSKNSKRDKKEKKDKKDRRSKKTSPVADDLGDAQSESEGDATESATEAAGSSNDNGTSASSKRKKSKDKSRRKARSSADSSTTGDGENSSKKKKKRRKDEEDGTTSLSAADSAVSTPTVSGSSTPIPGASLRHISRKRFIAHKQMALADPKALAQIFMIKSQN